MGSSYLTRCAEVARSGSDYLDGVLPAAVARRIELHLEECLVCRAQLDELRETIRLVGQLSDLELPETITDAPGRARALHQAGQEAQRLRAERTDEQLGDTARGSGREAG